MSIINDDDVIIAGNLSVGVDINNASLSECIDGIKQALDGYQNQISNKLENNTFEENKFYQEQINQSILEALDGYNDDGYIYATRSVVVPITGGFDYDTSPVPLITLSTTLPWLVSGARLNGTYTTGTYQGFFSCGVPIPQNYSSGGQFKVYCAIENTGNIYCEVAAGVIRMPANVAAGTYGTGQTTTYTTPGTNLLFCLDTVDLGEHNINKGDLLWFRVYRYATNANDVNNGNLYIVGAEFIYNAVLPKKITN